MKTLHFCTYPINRPTHGGQLRVSAIENRLKAEGITPIHFACYPQWAYSDGVEDNWTVLLDSKYLQNISKSMAVAMNLYCSNYILDNPVLYQKLVNQVQKAGVDVFFMEQPWLWPFVKKMREENTALANIPVVYSSQNIDANLFKDVIGLSGGLSESEIEAYFCEAKNLEEDCVRHAQLILAVTETDKAEFSKMGGRNVQLYPNGIHPPAAPTHLDYWSEKYQDKDFCFFVSSPFLPNALGVVKYLAPAGYLAPNQRIVIGGLIGEIIPKEDAYTKHVEINNARFQFLGKLEPCDLAAVYRLAKVIVLPIVGGGGSNLKTAEAIYSQKPILATSFAMRGYEGFLNSKQVFVEDDPTDFKRTLCTLLSRPLKTAASEDESHRLVLWENRLKALPQNLYALLSR